MPSRALRSTATKAAAAVSKKGDTVAGKGKKSSMKSVKEEKENMASKARVKREVKEESEEAVDAAPVKGRKRAKKDEAGTGEPDNYRTLRETVGQRVLKAAEGSTKWLGFHASISGTVANAIHDARSLGARSFALFVRNQRQWNAKPMDQGKVDLWRETVQETGFPLSMIIPHGSYLINPGSPDAVKLQKSRATMLDECKRAEQLGIGMYNFHPGSSTGTVSRDDCITTVAETMDYVLERTNEIVLVIETMAGQGHTVGGTFEEVRAVLDAVKGDQKRIGVCIDTCHIFAAGYDLRTRPAYDATMAEFDRIVGFDRLKAVHLNDSKSELGSNMDRHERIGKGLIGVEAFRYLMNDDRFNNIPLILETPEGEYASEMMLLYDLEERKKKVKNEAHAD